MNVLVVSHCGFEGNSSLHALAFATLAEQGGHDVAVAVPRSEPAVGTVAEPTFRTPTYDDVIAERFSFSGGRVDLVHAFTPREHVRRFTERVVQIHGCPYIVHLEDNEWAVLRDHVGLDERGLANVPNALVDALVPPYRLNPRLGLDFLAHATAATVVIEPLRAHVPDGVPVEVVWPGFDERFRALPAAAEARRQLRVPDSDLVISYTGNVHHSNVVEVRSLYLAVRALRERGIDVVLLRTGWNQLEPGWDSDVLPSNGLLELGFVSRERMPLVLAAADAHVQPGSPNAFNDLRFPSKLPDCLVSGRPVATSHTNIGRHLTHGENAFVMERGDALEIVEVLGEISARPERAAAIGMAGRSFALENLQWQSRAPALLSLYANAMANGRARRTFDSEPDKDASGAPVKTIAFYLPQFHEIPENNEWWGEGFTDWSNVRRATPQYAGHYQPQKPTELGYYDLSEPSVLNAQARLARESMIYGFCFYYYWFDRHRLLERPLDAFLAANDVPMPFCICWANENWTRRWDGLEEDVLLAQKYRVGWEESFIRDVLPVLLDDRYIRVDGQPLLLVYRPAHIPAIRRVTDRWRAIVEREAGLQLHLAAVQSFGLWDPTSLGFDAAVEFPPHTPHRRAAAGVVESVSPTFSGFIEDYREVMSERLGLALPEFPWYRGVMPSWDNTARRGDRAHLVVRSSPELYACWLRKVAIQALERASLQEPLVFINAWNEWGEGTHLEPDSRYGRGWLDATAGAIRDAVRQHWAARGVIIDESVAERYLRATLEVTGTR